MKEPSQFISMKFLEAMHHKSHGSDPITVLSHKEKKLAKKKNNNFKVHFSGVHVAASLTIVTTIDVLLSIIIFYYLFIY